MKRTTPSAILLLTILFALTTRVSVAVAEDGEYFGVFSGEPSLKVQSHSSERPTFFLLEEFKFKDPNGHDWITPKGWEVDGASIPKVAWSIVGGPMSGNYLQASIIHDYYCDRKTRTAHDTHRNFYYGMRANGVSEKKAKIMYWAVRTFGPSWRLKKVRGFGLHGGSFRYERTDISPPQLSDEKAHDLITSLNPSISLVELDRISDGLREAHGSEQT